MVKYLNYIFVSIIAVILSTGCTRTIDFEHDVPQRAKSISKQQADNVRSSMEVPELKKEYKNYVMQQRKAKSLADLEKEKREIEKKIAYMIQADSSKVCAVCRKKLKMKPSPKSLVMQKINKTKNNAKKKKKTSTKPGIVKAKAKQAEQSSRPEFDSKAVDNKQGTQQQPFPENNQQFFPQQLVQGVPPLPDNQQPSFVLNQPPAQLQQPPFAGTPQVVFQQPVFNPPMLNNQPPQPPLPPQQYVPVPAY